MSKEQLFWIIVALWSLAVIAMCVWLYRAAHRQDNIEDQMDAVYEEALVENAVFDFNRKHADWLVVAAMEGSRKTRGDWQDNARSAEGNEDFWDGAA